MSTSLPPDPYKVLGVSRDAQVAEIRSAHRKLILKCHPDKVQDANLKAEKQDEFQQVQRAYELLSDDNERQKYDDQVKLAELRRQMQNKMNISSPRSSNKYAGEYEVRTAEPRTSTFKSGTPPASRTYTYSRSWEEDADHGSRMFEPETRSSRREHSYSEKPSKRAMEKEREREKDRDRERDRDRRRREEEIRRAEKEDKEARRAAKKLREKMLAKEIKRDAEEKRKFATPYVEVYDDEVPLPRSLRKKASDSRKYDEVRERDRSSGREEVPLPQVGASRIETTKLNYATSYIKASQVPSLQRAATYHAATRSAPVPVAAPTPPPVASQGSPFPIPDDDDVRRSSARPRRGSGESHRLSRERSYRTSSREDVDPVVVNASPNARHAPQFSKSPSFAPVLSASPPRLPRTQTMPPEQQAYTRSIPAMTRAQTFDTFHEQPDPRGRHRSRMNSQVEEEEDSDDYDRRARDRKHRSSKKTRSPEHVSRYADHSRSKSYNYAPQAEHDPYHQYYTSGVRVVETRPSMPARESSYTASAGAAKFPKVKTSKAFSPEDVQYSTHQYQRPVYREEYPVYAQ